MKQIFRRGDVRINDKTAGWQLRIIWVENKMTEKVDRPYKAQWRETSSVILIHIIQPIKPIEC